MTTATQKMIERIPLEVINNDKFELIDELYRRTTSSTRPAGRSPDARRFQADGDRAEEGVSRPALRVEDFLDAGDRFVHRLTASGTMKGEFVGIPATGKHATWTEIHIGRIVNGRLTEHWGVIDQLGMLVQLGVIEPPVRVPVTA